MSPGGGDTQKHGRACSTSVARYHDYSDHHARRPLSLGYPAQLCRVLMLGKGIWGAHTESAVILTTMHQSAGRVAKTETASTETRKSTATLNSLGVRVQQQA